VAWSGGPIEVLVIDIAKSTEVADHVAASFFPALVPGRSIVVQQDFLHEAQPWLPVQMELFGGHFVPLAKVGPHGMSYLCTASVAGADIAAARTGALDDSAMLGLLQAAQTRFAGRAFARQFEKAMARLSANPGLRTAGALRKAGSRQGPAG